MHRALMVICGCWFVGAARADEAASPPDNGTDPTLLRSSASAFAEHLDQRGGTTRDTLKLSLSVPVGAATAVTLMAPVAWVDAAGRRSSGPGDVSVKLSRITSVTREGGIVLQGELVFDSARRPELGNGTSVFKGTFVYAVFLDGGTILAPTVAQSQGLGRGAGGERISSTVFDLYYVPQLADPHGFLTLDPALTVDWTHGQAFGSLAVNFGRVLGPAFGGSSQVYVKPSAFIGGARRANWGFEAGFKVLGF